MMMAKNEFRFLNSRQLEKATSTTSVRETEEAFPYHQLSIKRAHLQSESVFDCLRAPHSLSSDLDELLEQLNPFAELTTQTHLRHHPQLHLVEPDHDHTIPPGSNNTL
jgi:hypothetical protein